jgi:transformation/transcription domain-associated protein
MRNIVENLPELTSFINLMMPLFLNYLSVASGPKFQDCPEHRIRLLILEIINRLPNNHEALRAHAIEANSVLMNILENDNEENALVALRIFIDLHRNFRAVLEEKEVQPFLDFVVNLYENLPTTVHEIFDARNGAGLVSPTQPSPFASSADTPGSSNASEFGVTITGKHITKSSASFKVLTECPIIIVILFQLYRKYVANNIPRFVEVIIQVRGLDLCLFECLLNLDLFN